MSDENISSSSVSIINTELIPTHEIKLMTEIRNVGQYIIELEYNSLTVNWFCSIVLY